MHITCDAEIGNNLAKLRPLARDLSKTAEALVLICLDREQDKSSLICAFRSGMEVSTRDLT